MAVRKRTPWKQIVFISLAAVLIAGIGAYANYRHLERQSARIPASIRSELTFSPFIVTLDNQEYKATDYNLFNDEKDVQHLFFNVSYDGTRVAVTQTVQPPQFVEIPEYKQRFLENVINQYSTVQTSNGTIYLGKQSKQDYRQHGIMLERGLLVLFNPSKELTQAEWRRLGDQFDIQKITN